jgi:hypothetical protein
MPNFSTANEEFDVPEDLSQSDRPPVRIGKGKKKKKKSKKKRLDVTLEF